MASTYDSGDNMARLACFLVLLAVATCSALESRIVGGSPTSIENRPFMVQIQRQWFPQVWSQRCAGNILTSRWVLTAARCTRGSFITTRFLRVLAGTSFRNTGGLKEHILSVINHPSFEEQIGYDGDLALVRLANPLTFSELIGQTGIVRQGEVIPDGFPAIQAGWGVTLEELPDIRATRLYEVVVSTVNNARCAESYANFIIPRTVTRNMICAGRPEGGAGACIGDTGGPLLINNVLVGVISWGWGCRNATFPRVHTAISSYSDWIVRTAV